MEIILTAAAFVKNLIRFGFKILILLKKYILFVRKILHELKKTFSRKYLFSKGEFTWLQPQDYKQKGFKAQT